MICLPAIISSLVAVSIDTSEGLMLPQKLSSFMRCASKVASIVRSELDNCIFVSEMWASILGAQLETVGSSVVVAFSTCASAVQPVLLSLSSDFESSPFFLSLFLPPH